MRSHAAARPPFPSFTPVYAWRPRSIVMGLRQRSFTVAAADSAAPWQVNDLRPSAFAGP
jgi:hypothetical protein